MKVQCDSCKAVFNVPDEKLPQDQVVKIPCPKCKDPITVDTRAKPAEEPGVQVDEDPDAAALDFVEEGVKIALICSENSDIQAKSRAALEGMDYRVFNSTNLKDAMSKIRYHHFDVVVLDEKFSGEDHRSNAILRFFMPMPMSTRRRMFLALVGNDFRSMDNMAAFSLSVNVVINTNDLDQMDKMFYKSISENDKFYKVFWDAYRELGKG